MATLQTYTRLSRSLPSFISASSIKVSAGTEGPRHDPYSFDEWTLTRGSNVWLIHSGLDEWVKLNGVLCPFPAGSKLSDVLKASGCPLSMRELQKCYARIRAVPLKLHKPHGRPHSSDGFPGEELLICPCGAVLDCHFDISAIE